MYELRTISGELGAAIQHCQNNENEGGVQRLAAWAGAEGPIRRAIVIENRNQQRGVHLDAPAINEVQKFLDNMSQMNEASLRWLRYCYRPINAGTLCIFMACF
jgi:hypothetical protein